MTDDERLENGDDTPTVFIVDDESMVTSALEAFLGLETSYRVETFNTPHEALHTFSQSGMDVLVLGDDVIEKPLGSS